MDKKAKAATAGQRCCGRERGILADKQLKCVPQCHCKSKCQQCQCNGKASETSGGVK